MSDILAALGQHISDHWVVYSTAAVALSTATISCMPQKRPRAADEWWVWLRASLQTAIPARHNPVPPEPVQSPNFTPPVAPAPTK